MKKETLEEAKKNYVYDKYKQSLDDVVNNAIDFGAKWQQERSYSEDDMKSAFIAGGNSQIEEDDAYGSAYLEYMEEWFEQFKKK